MTEREKERIDELRHDVHTLRSEYRTDMSEVRDELRDIRMAAGGLQIALSELGSRVGVLVDHDEARSGRSDFRWKAIAAFCAVVTAIVTVVVFILNLP